MPTAAERMERKRKAKEQRQAQQALERRAAEEQKLATLGSDYGELSGDQRDLLQMAALEIRRRLKRSVEDMVEIGRQLNAVKQILPDKFEAWIKAEFGMSRATASEYRNAADRFAEHVQLLYMLTPTIVRRLAAPSVPDEAVAKVIAASLATNKPLRVQDAMAIVKPFLPPKLVKPKQLPPPPMPQLTGPVAETEPDDAIDAEYTVYEPPPGDVVRLRRELLLKMIDGAAHKVFMPFLTRAEHDELFIALTRALGE